MKTVTISKIMSVLLLVLVTACGGMDETYKDFIGDAPIVYLQKYDADSIKVQLGRERVMMTLPRVMDPRIDYARITWANGTYEKKVPLTFKESAQFLIDENLPEGMYDFMVTNHTDDGLYSISSSVVGETYGAIYESYLRNRNLQKIEVDFQTSNITIHFPLLNDSTIQGTEFKWVKDGVEIVQYFPNTEDNLVFIENFPIDDENIGAFQYRTHVLPNGESIDIFYSQWQTYRFLVEEEMDPATFDPAAWSFSLSQPNIVEGTNGPPSQMIDGNVNSFMAMRKPGQGNDGNGIPVPLGAEYYFIIDLQEEIKFDYIEWYHRGDNTGLGLRAWAVALYGSNDGIDFEIIDTLSIPGETDTSVKMGTLKFKESTYRYLKIQFARWNLTTSTAIQIGEFKLGYSKTIPTGKGIGVGI